MEYMDNKKNALSIFLARHFCCLGSRLGPTQRLAAQGLEISAPQHARWDGFRGIISPKVMCLGHVSYVWHCLASFFFNEL